MSVRNAVVVRSPRLKVTGTAGLSLLAIAVALNEFTVEVDVHDTTLTVKPENLNKIDSPEAHRQLPQIKQRILRLRECENLDRCALTVLESLGKQTYLTAVEDGLLQWLEKHYGVIR